MSLDQVCQVCEDGERIDAVRTFFDQWNLYQKIMHNDYLYHHKIYKMLHELLSVSSHEPFSVLDLGCGDAFFMSKALSGTPVDRYTGVDISAIALDLARNNMAERPCSKSFVNGDFYALLDGDMDRFDLIWIGLSMHHLSLLQKDHFITRCCQILKPDGCLMAFEPTMRDGEDRDEFCRRWRNVCICKWNALSDEEKEAISGHVYSSDFPESLTTLRQIGTCHGFRDVKSLFCDPDEIYQLACLQK
ncbi:MAG TPA: class I SAM-dependent methyltransferase [Methanotrichaceae archaeon]|nr:class I SAM-dependent methyltransferase [Methanotrichaceae archaeon]